MKKTKIINLFGAPSSGKSTTAAGVFHLMKLKKINCELVTEHAKQMTWEECPPKAFDNQLVITAQQYNRMHWCLGKVDYIVTDSPILMGLAYTPEDYFQNFTPLLLEVFNSFENINFFIKRVKPYNPVGRSQSEAESDKLIDVVKNILDKHAPDYSIVDGDEAAPQKIIDSIFCSECNNDWLDHEFGVPAPYCPPKR